MHASEASTSGDYHVVHALIIEKRLFEVQQFITFSAPCLLTTLFLKQALEALLPQRPCRHPASCRGVSCLIPHRPADREYKPSTKRDGAGGVSVWVWQIIRACTLENHTSGAVAVLAYLTRHLYCTWRLASFPDHSVVRLGFSRINALFMNKRSDGRRNCFCG